MPKKTDAGSAHDWMAFVKADLDAVRLLAKHRVSFHVCESKLAEAFEKALKADLVNRGWRLERIHDVQKLCDHLARYDANLAQGLQSLADELAGSYTQGRYPGFDLEHADWPELDRQFREVRRYVRVLEKRIHR